jgi:hypothetical protein
MKRFQAYYAYAIALAVTICFFSCRKDIQHDSVELSNISSDQKVEIPAVISEGKYNTFYGPAINIGDGHMRSWVNINDKGEPLGIGVEITDGALMNLPHDVQSFSEVSFILPLHQKARAVTPYDHIEIDWNEHGHEPPGIYDLPHFDFHFYMISLKEQLAIPSYEDASSLFDNLPPAEYLPSLYIRGPGGVPQMGVHWVDILSPEFNGGDFTTTFLYGSYDGKVTFHEPMVTMNVIESGATIHKDIRQPQLFSLSNRYFPTEYSIWKDSRTGRHYLSLNTMVLR